MEQNLIIVEDLETLALVKEYISNPDFNYVAYDTETTGLDKGAEVIGYSICAEEHIGIYVILAKWEFKTEHAQCEECPAILLTKHGKPRKRQPVCKECNGTTVITKRTGELTYNDEIKKESAEIIKILSEKSLIMHNAVFDCEMTRREFGIELMPSVHTDTMILAHLLDENNSIGLKELSQKFFGESAVEEQAEMQASVLRNGGIWSKAKGGTKEMYKADPYTLGKYGAKDTILTYKLFQTLVPQLFEENLDKFFYEEESMPLLKGPTYQMNTTGLKVDTVKLKELGVVLEHECARLEAEILEEIYPKIKDRYPYDGSGTKFNIGSNNQVAWLLFIRLGNEFKKLTDAGRKLAKDLIGKAPYNASEKRKFLRSIGEERQRLEEYLVTEDESLRAEIQKRINKLVPEKYLQCDKDTLSDFAKKYEWVAKLLKHNAAKKIMNTYCEGITKRMKYGVIHPSFKQAGTTSGRYACIAENQIVSMPGGDKYIQDVKPGDLVYCYTQDGRPTISKVSRVYDNGVQDCIEITWESQGARKRGSLVCTPDHKIKLRSNQWKEAKDLKYGDRVYHLRRAKNSVNGRLRIYAANKYMKNEEQMIKEEGLQFSTNFHAHHINENKLDNRVENIVALPSKDHISFHTKERISKGELKWERLRLHRPKPRCGTENPLWKSFTRFGALRTLAKAHGRLTKVDADFDTFKRKLELLSIDYRAVKDRYNSAGIYLSRGFIRKIMEANTIKKQAVLASGVNHYKYTGLVEYYGLDNNHRFIHSRFIGKRRVYDLEVETHHNFIAGELCVHNCSNPNFQNLPRDDKRVKSCITAREGKVFVGADYSQLEPRTFASVSQDPALLACFEKGEDFYSVVGIPIFKDFTYSAFKEHEKSWAKAYPNKRHIAKAFALAKPYGTTAFQQSDKLRDEEGNHLTPQQCQEIMDAYEEAYPLVHQMMLDSHDMAKRDGVVYSLFGRPRRIPEAKRIARIYGFDVQHGDLPYQERGYLNLAMNHRVQSSAASIVNRAMIAFYNKMQELQIDAKIILQVHDEIVVECWEKDKEIVKRELKHAMENTITLPGVRLIAEPVIAKNLADLK